MADPVSSSLRVIRALSKADDVPRGVIRAYHGSPHSFSRFDASRIGTGEGAQAYGHGLYFAGKEDVARTYRDISPAVLSDAAAKALQEMQQRAVQLELEAGSIWDAMEQAASERGALALGWGTMRDVPQDVQQSLGPRLKKIGEQLATLRMEQQRARDGLRGHMYEVEIPHPAEALLDYDRPFSTPVGRLALSAVGDMLPSPPTRSLTRDLRQGLGVAAGPHSGSRNAFDNAAGQLIELAKTPSGSSALLDAGIPGVRYLDGSSRAAGQGSRNFVMFPGTEERIRILRQYGLLPPLLGAAALEDE